MAKKEKNKEEQPVYEVEPKVEVTPYDNMVVKVEKQQKEEHPKHENTANANKQINLTFSISGLSSVLAVASLALTFIFALIVAFGVNVHGAVRGIFFLITTALAVTSVVMAYKNSGHKPTIPLLFSVCAVIVNLIVYF